MDQANRDAARAPSSRGRPSLQAFSQEAGSALGTFVVPFFGEKRAELEAVGSAVLLAVQDRRLLLTAAHVLDELEQRSLYLGRSERPFGPGVTRWVTPRKNDDPRRRSDLFDFGFAELAGDELEDASLAGSFLEIGGVATAISDEPSTCAALGFPQSWNRWRAQKKRPFLPDLTSWAERELADGEYERFAEQLRKKRGEDFRFSRATHLAVRFDPKNAAEDGERLTPPQLQGMSGGGIWVEAPAGSSQRFVLAAISTDCVLAEKAIFGTRIQECLRAVASKIPELAAGLGVASN